MLQQLGCFEGVRRMCRAVMWRHLPPLPFRLSRLGRVKARRAALQAATDAPLNGSKSGSWDFPFGQNAMNICCTYMDARRCACARGELGQTSWQSCVRIGRTGTKTAVPLSGSFHAGLNLLSWEKNTILKPWKSRNTLQTEKILCRKFGKEKVFLLSVAACEVLTHAFVWMKPV